MIAVRTDTFTIGFTPEAQKVLATLRSMRGAACLRGDRLWVAVTLLEWIAERDTDGSSMVTVEASLARLAKVREDEGYAGKFDENNWKGHVERVLADLASDPELIFQD